MKKYILPLLAVALFVSCDNKKDQEIEALKEKVAYLEGAADQRARQEAEAPAPAEAPKPAAKPSTVGRTFYACGNISVYPDAIVEVVNGSGHVTFGGQRRDLRYVSFDPSTKQLTYGAYYGGKYIGNYVGTFNTATGNYKGVFYNTQNGGKVNFDLWEMRD